jgi:signal transduction histidine kinase
MTEAPSEIPRHAHAYIRQRIIRISRDGLVVWLRSIGIAAAVGVAYFLAAELSNSFLITPETVIFWPAAGISSGLLISLWSIARWPVLAGVIVATAAANLLRHFGVATTAVWVIGNTAEPLIIAALVQHYFGAHFKIDRLYCVLGLFAAAVAGTAVASTWWTFVYYWLVGSLNEPAATWLHWIVSDFCGIVSVAPLVIGLAAALQQPPSWREVIEGVAPLAVLGVMTGVIVLLPPAPWQTVLPAALVFPMLLWLAARSQPVLAAAGASVVSISVALTAIYGLGHFGDASLSIDARVLQTEAIILVVAIGTTVLAALFAERRESEARLAQSNMLLERERDNRLSSIDAITASIVHEVRQPLAAIAANGSAARTLLESTSPNVPEARAALDDMIDDSRRIGSALESARTLFRRFDQEHDLIDLNSIALRVLHSMDGELRRQEVKAQTILTPKMPSIRGNRNQLHQVMLNLIHNAMEAMVETTGRTRTLKIRTQLHGPNAVALSVEDSGSGIGPERLSNIFEVYVTTKPQGMGLGLAICRTIIESHGGQLTVSSDGKNGATFKVVLPIEPSNEATVRRAG